MTVNQEDGGPTPLASAKLEDKMKKIEKNHVHNWSVSTDEDHYSMREFGETPRQYAIVECRCGAKLDSSDIEEVLNSVEREKMKGLEK